jgi:alkanesulfonate monooxygenase SsuD/methylene tetrahydromethanopterin reductase-like flavin-dependent oxidoreductase (luciferase family)
MEIAIGLPATVPGVDREALLSFARRGEERGFSSLGTLDRLAYPNYDPLVALGAAAGVTEEIRLLTDVVNVPWRHNAALLAKQAATVDSLSGGRLTLGIGLGAREDDYAASGAPQENLGRQLDAAIETMRQAWSGEPVNGTAPVGPPPVREGGPELLIGGMVDASLRRVARYGDGWTMGGGTPDMFRESLGKLREAWQAAGREGEPRTMALFYYALGDGAKEAAASTLGDYYAFLGDYASQVVDSAATDEDTVKGYLSAFEEAGADEVICFPVSTDLEQVDLLARAAGL